MVFENQILGVIRFSYPATDGFSVSFWPQDKREAYLYDDVRMAQRFKYLETLALPSLAAQTDRGFKVMILAGETMPRRHKMRLREIRDAHDFIELLFFPAMGGAGASKRAFKRGVEEGSTHVTGFRIDDDDAVAIDYVEKNT